MTLTALLLATGAAALAGPVAGVAIAGRQAAAAARTPELRRAPALRRSRTLVLETAALTVAFMVVCLTVNGAARPASPLTAAPFLALGAAFLAACAIGVACGARLADPLDAAACALGITITATFGVLALGPVVAAAPAAVVDAAVALSPVAATASAARLDVFRSEPLYQISPLAHTHLTYPAWTTAALVDMIVAAGCLGVAARTLKVEGLSSRKDRPMPERMNP